MLNRLFVKVWPCRHLAMTNFVVACGPRPEEPARHIAQPTVTTRFVPARNEAGTCLELGPNPPIGPRTELSSSMVTPPTTLRPVLEREPRRFTRLSLGALDALGKGKGKRRGLPAFEAARGLHP